MISSHYAMRSHDNNSGDYFCHATASDRLVWWRSPLPKVVDHQVRRRAIAEAVFTVIGSRGMAGVSLREVALEAGVSMGSVQHYFATKDEMLLFALSHMRERAGARFAADLAKLDSPSRRDYLQTVLGILLPTTQEGRQEAIVNAAFFSVAPGSDQYRPILANGYSDLAAIVRQVLVAADADNELAAGIDVDKEAAALFYATEGLIGPVLIGIMSATQALAILDHQLDRIFTSAKMKSPRI